MKLLTILLTSLIFSSVHAKDVEIFSSIKEYDLDVDYIRFRTNPKLDEAWVEITLADDSDWEETWYSSHDVYVEGLYYDSVSKEIIYADDSSKVVCANIVTKTRFGRTRRYIHKTGNCTFKSKVVSVFEHNGRYRTKKKSLKIILQTKAQ